MSRSISAMRRQQGGWNTPKGAWMTGVITYIWNWEKPSLKRPSNVFRFTSIYVSKTSHEDQVAKRKTV